MQIDKRKTREKQNKTKQKKKRTKERSFIHDFATRRPNTHEQHHAYIHPSVRMGHVGLSQERLLLRGGSSRSGENERN